MDRLVPFLFGFSYVSAIVFAIGFFVRSWYLKNLQADTFKLSAERLRHIHGLRQRLSDAETQRDNYKGYFENAIKRNIEYVKKQNKLQDKIEQQDEELEASRLSSLTWRKRFHESAANNNSLELRLTEARDREAEWGDQQQTSKEMYADLQSREQDYKLRCEKLTEELEKLRKYNDLASVCIAYTRDSLKDFDEISD